MDTIEDDHHKEEEELDIKLYSIKVEEDNKVDSDEDEEYVLGLNSDDEDLDIKTAHKWDTDNGLKKDHSCDQCSLQFHTIMSLAKHKTSTHPPPYTCSTCSITLKSVVGFLKHCADTCTDIVGRKPRFGRCTECGAAFTVKSQITLHGCTGKAKRSKKRGKMEFIMDTFLTQLPVKNEGDDGSSTTGSGPGRCGRPVERGTDDKTPQQCLICGKISSTLLLAVAHVRAVHKIELKAANPTAVTCEECGFLAHNEASLKRHKTCKHARKPSTIE